jgi:dUTP pyrophosphatase
MSIAQMVIQYVPIVQLTEVNELSESERGASGFGSSGAK